MEVIANAGVMALASMFVCLLPLAMGIACAIWPSEHRLALMRTLSLAAVFATISGTALGFVNELRFVARTAPISFSPVVATGLAEGLVLLFFGFGCLTVGWLCVTIGLWRRSERAV